MVAGSNGGGTLQTKGKYNLFISFWTNGLGGGTLQTKGKYNNVG